MAMVAGTVRLGFIADLLSRPVVVGYLAGVALIMIAGQLGAATGVPVAGGAFPAQVVSFGERITEARPAAAVAAAALVFLFLVQWRWPRAPWPLLEAVEALRGELARGGTVFALARVKQGLLVRLKAFGLAAKIGPDRLFPTLPTAVAAYQRWAAGQGQRSGEEPGESRESA